MAYSVQNVDKIYDNMKTGKILITLSREVMVRKEMKIGKEEGTFNSRHYYGWDSVWM